MNWWFTSELGLVPGQRGEAVPERRQDSLHGSEHGAESEVEQHEEEERRPEGAAGQLRHGLREGDEGQTRPLHALQPNAAAVSAVQRSKVSLKTRLTVCISFSRSQSVKLARVSPCWLNQEL